MPRAGSDDAVQESAAAGRAVSVGHVGRPNPTRAADSVYPSRAGGGGRHLPPNLSPRSGATARTLLRHFNILNAVWGLFTPLSCNIAAGRSAFMWHPHPFEGV